MVAEAIYFPITETEFCFGEEPSLIISVENHYFLSCRVLLNSCVSTMGSPANGNCNVTAIIGYELMYSTYSGTFLTVLVIEYFIHNQFLGLSIANPSKVPSCILKNKRITLNP